MGDPHFELKIVILMSIVRQCNLKCYSLKLMPVASYDWWYELYVRTSWRSSCTVSELTLLVKYLSTSQLTRLCVNRPSHSETGQVLFRVVEWKYRELNSKEEKVYNDKESSFCTSWQTRVSVRSQDLVWTKWNIEEKMKNLRAVVSLVNWDI